MYVMAAGERAVLPLAKKINTVEKGEKYRSTLADEFSIARSTITVLYRKEIREAFESSQFGPNRKRL